MEGHGATRRDDGWVIDDERYEEICYEWKAASSRRTPKNLAELARFYAFFAGFVQEGVDLGLEVYLFGFEVGHLLGYRLAVVAFVEFAVGGAYGFAFAEVFRA